MLWKLKSKDGEIELTPAQLLDSLMSKHLTVVREDFEVLSLEFAKFLQFKTAMHEATLGQLLLIAFSMGYFYRVFKDKNQVEIVHESINSEDGESSSSEDCNDSSSNRDN